MMRRLTIPWLALSLMAATAAHGAAAQGARPEGKPAQSQHGNHRGPRQLMLENADGALITLWKPDLTTQRLELSHGAVTLAGTGMDNYHAVIAEQDWGDSKEAVIRYEYLFGRPSQHSPSELAGAVKTDLEIVPAPIPREHFRYFSGERWGFQVRLFGKPAANLPLTLETANGTRLEAVTDADGYARFMLPDDFPDVVTGERDRRSAEFAVSGGTTNGGKSYQTRLTATYHLSPSHWQSSPLGWAVVGIGFVAGGLLGRQKGRGVKNA